MKEILDSKQKLINDCGSGMVVLYYGEKEVSQTERVQTGTDTFIDKAVTRYQYDKLELTGVVQPVNEQNVLEKVRSMVTDAIKSYDTSANVNVFTLTKDGVSIDYWLPAEKRLQLKNSVTIWKAAKKGDYTLDIREKGASIAIDCEKLLTMLNELETYAILCFGTTSQHLNAVGQMDDIEQLLTYDYTTGYPEKLTFEV